MKRVTVLIAVMVSLLGAACTPARSAKRSELRVPRETTLTVSATTTDVAATLELPAGVLRPHVTYPVVLKAVNRGSRSVMVWDLPDLAVTGSSGQVVDDWYRRLYGSATIRLGTSLWLRLTPDRPFVRRMDFVLPGPGRYRLRTALASRTSTTTETHLTLETTVAAR